MAIVTLSTASTAHATVSTAQAQGYVTVLIARNSCMRENYQMVDIKKEKKEMKTGEASPFFLFVLEKKGRVILFCKHSKRFFVMDKAEFHQTAKEYLAKNLLPQFKFRGDYFRYLCVTITSKCNMACKYCFGSQAARTGKTNRFKVIQAAINYIAKQKKPVEVMFASAGEHTLEAGLLEKTLKYMNKKLELSRVRISCNGTMNPETYLRLRDYFSSFQISLDGPPKIQDLQRPMKGGGKSSKRVEAVLRELKRNNKSFQIKATLTPNHLGKEEETFRYFYDLEIPEVIFSTVGDLGSGDAYYKRSRKGQLSLLQLKIKELCDEFGLRSKVLTEIHLKGKETGFCDVGRSFHLGVDGTVSGCLMYSDKKDLQIHPGMDKLIIGKFNLAKGEFDMDEKRIKELRDIHKKAHCYNCQFKLCWGGCPYRNLRRHGKAEKPDKNLCRDRKKETKEFLEYLAQRNVIKIKPCLLEKGNRLYYSLQFSEFPLIKCSSENIISKSAFVVFDPAEDNLEEMARKMVFATKKRKNIVLFVLSPKYSNRLNRKKSILFQEFLCSLRENRVLFKISSPIKITAPNAEEENSFYKKFQIPQNCFDCLEMFKLKAGHVIFCNGIKGPRAESFFNRDEIFFALQKKQYQL